MGEIAAEEEKRAEQLQDFGDSEHLPETHPETPAREECDEGARMSGLRLVCFCGFWRFFQKKTRAEKLQDVEDFEHAETPPETSAKGAREKCDEGAEVKAPAG